MKIYYLATMLFLSSSLFAQKKTSPILIDTHGDILFNQIKSGIDIGKLQKTGYFDLVRAKKGGLNAQFFSVWSDGKGDYKVANQQIDSLNSLIKRYPNKIELVQTATALEKAVRNNKMAALIGVEGGHMIDNRLDYIDSLAKRGMSYLTLTWNNSTPWASSAAEETSSKIPADKAGLNEFGKQVVARLNKLGVMVDLSHVGEKTFHDAIAASTKPIIVSHSCAYAINPVPRNLKDDQIKAVAKNKGVICINFYSGFVDSTYKTKQREFAKKFKDELEVLSQKYGRSDAMDTLMTIHAKEADAIRPPVSIIVDHINYIVKLIGIDYVGLGADFDGAESFPQGLNSVADYPLVEKELRKNGYKDEDIKKILGGNVIRVLKANKGA